MSNHLNESDVKFLQEQYFQYCIAYYLAAIMVESVKVQVSNLNAAWMVEMMILLIYSIKFEEQFKKNQRPFEEHKFYDYFKDFLFYEEGCDSSLLNLLQKIQQIFDVVRYPKVEDVRFASKGGAFKGKRPKQNFLINRDEVDRLFHHLYYSGINKLFDESDFYFHLSRSNICLDYYLRDNRYQLSLNN